MGCMYRSPNSNVAQNDKFNKTMIQASQSDYTHVLLMGDFNHPEIDWSGHACSAPHNHPASQFLEATMESYLTQHVRNPTHYRGNQTPNTLDLIFTNEEGMIDEVLYGPPLGKSHHVVLTFDFLCYSSNTENKRTSYMYQKGNYEAIRTYLGTVDWDKELTDKTTEECWTVITNHLNEAKRRYIPRLTNTGKEPVRKKPLWLDNTAMKKVKKKHAAWRRYMQTREGQDYNDYCRARNQVKQATKHAMKDYESKIAKEAKTNPSGFFKYIRSKTSTRSGIGDLVTEGNTAVSDKDKAETLNKFFASVFTREDNASLPKFEDREYKSPLETMTFTVETVLKKLNKLNPSKSPGPDGIHPMLLKEAQGKIAYDIRHV